ncbi:glycosyltransferase [Pseudomonas putida]|uniref:glycosyltransferase n=2 Tax=Pseudomonas putida group TaxID=136845 RepID=UPI0021191EAE|nr:glycosyltransferase [Pseudomonas putida]
MQLTAAARQVDRSILNRADSGVTTYTNLAHAELSSLGLTVKTISIKPDETLNDFCYRLKIEVNQTSDLVCIEAPESLASTREIDSSAPLHIRLHCSRSLGAVVQGLPYSKDDVALEQREIKRAKYLSSPSWASYFASKVLFKISAPPSIYPNPAPSPKYGAHTNNTYDVTFVGRFQKLKGTHYLLEIAALLPKLKFAVFCPPLRKPINATPNITFFDGTGMEKSEIYSKSGLVIVPSIFETSSMVVIEALSFGCQVVTWDHLGAVEYFGSVEELTTAPSNNIEAFKSEILSSLEKPRRLYNNSLPNTLNSLFRMGTENLLLDQKKRQIIDRPNRKVERYLTKLVKTQLKAIMKKNQSPFIKKTHKLFTNPIAFFRDSKEVKFIHKKLKDRRLAKLVDLKEEFKDHPLLQTKKETVVVESPAVKALLDVVEPKQQKSILKNYITSIGNEGRIEFKVQPTKPKGYSTAFLHHKKADKSLLIGTLEKLNEFSDFKYVNTERMQLGLFDISEEHSPLSVINRIDTKNKTNLAEISFLIVLDAPANLCFALRYSGTDQQVILVKTDETLQVAPESIDALITLHPEANPSQIKRLITVEDETGIPIAIRRVLQDLFPRKKNMLLPILVDDECNFDKTDISSFDDENYQGIIKIIPIDHRRSTTMNHIHEDVANSVIGIMVLESIYMKYRSLCEAVEQGESPATLINVCLKDGVMFDVQEV